MYQVNFKQALVRIPQCKEDRNTADFEKFVAKFAEGKRNEMFVKYPYQVEAMVMSFEDTKNVYKIHTDPAKGTMKLKKYKQEKGDQEYRAQCNSAKRKLQEYGISLLGEVFTLVSIKSVVGLDEKKDTMEKYFFKTPLNVPLSICMRRRTKSHYQNVEERLKNVYGRVSEAKQAICFAPGLLGVMGTVKRPEKNMVKFDIDREEEEGKVHDPFFALTMMQN